mmetsp:Transcript_31772/g.51620  ORF Transcript_31772/g.51620 Transcript_31772/m.51620 type:complete len:126 (+) Transcript_31772:141-518(+)
MGLAGLCILCAKMDCSLNPFCGFYCIDCIPFEYKTVFCVLICILMLATIGVIVGIFFAIASFRCIIKKHTKVAKIRVHLRCFMESSSSSRTIIIHCPHLCKIFWRDGEAERVMVVDLSKYPVQIV